MSAPAPHLLTRFPAANQRAFRQALADSRILGIQAVADLYHEQLAREGRDQLWRRATHCALPWPHVWGEWHLPWPWGQAPGRTRSVGELAPHLGTMVVAQPISSDPWEGPETTVHPDSRLDLFCFGSQIRDAWAGTATILVDPRGGLCRSQENPEVVLTATRLSDAFVELLIRSPEVAPLRATMAPRPPEEMGVTLLHLTWVLPMLLALTYYNRQQIFVMDSHLMLVPPARPDEPTRLTPLHTFHLPLADPRNN
ncbi:MAG: hypothetical protein WC713_05995 [Candidatus Methylomirabilota bacterium]